MSAVLRRDAPAISFIQVEKSIQEGRQSIQEQRQFADAYLAHNIAVAEETAKSDLSQKPFFVAKRIMARLDVIANQGEGAAAYYAAAAIGRKTHSFPRAIFMAPDEAAAVVKDGKSIKVTPYAVIDTGALSDRHDTSNAAMRSQYQGARKVDVVIDHSALVRMDEGRADQGERFVNSRDPSHGAPYSKLTGSRAAIHTTDSHRMGVIIDAKALQSRPALVVDAARMAINAGADVIRVSGANTETMANLFTVIAGHNGTKAHKVLLSSSGATVTEAATHLALADRILGPGNTRREFRIAGTQAFYNQLSGMLLQAPGRMRAPAQALRTYTPGSATG